MFTRCKLLGLLTSHQLKLLKALHDLSEFDPVRLWRPRELGACRSSHHNKTLKSLEEQGLVARVEVRRGLRPTFGYRITEAGIATWNDFRELADVRLHGVMGRCADRQRAQWTRALAGGPSQQSAL